MPAKEYPEVTKVVRGLSLPESWYQIRSEDYEKRILV
jgi:hypothetical protein